MLRADITKELSLIAVSKNFILIADRREQLPFSIAVKNE